MTKAPGFTLLELCIAIMLSSVLMIGVLAVITDLQNTTLADDDDDPPRGREEFGGDATDMESALNGLVELLRDDLKHAGMIEVVRTGEVALTGYCALDKPRCERVHRPVRVVYALENMAGRSWLVRRQEYLDVATNRHVQRDLVCSGVRRFELVSMIDGRETAVSAKSGGVRLASPGAGGGDPTPGQPGADEPDADPSGAEGERQNSGSDGTGPNAPSAKNGKDQCILVNGLLFYPHYAPRWALKNGSAESESDAPAEAEQDLAEMGDDGSDAPARNADGANTGRPSDGAETEEGVTRIAWRLRVWTGAGDEPDYDRMVRAQVSGAYQ